MNETIGQEFFLTPSARRRQETTAFMKSEFEKLKKQYSDKSNWQIAGAIRQVLSKKEDLRSYSQQQIKMILKREGLYNNTEKEI